MKQNSLNAPFPIGSAAKETCLGRLITVWALYGIAMAVLWSFAGPSPWMRVAAWALALIVGIKIERCLRED